MPRNLNIPLTMKTNYRFKLTLQSHHAPRRTHFRSTLKLLKNNRTVCSAPLQALERESIGERPQISKQATTVSVFASVPSRMSVRATPCTRSSTLLRSICLSTALVLCGYVTFSYALALKNRAPCFLWSNRLSPPPLALSSQKSYSVSSRAF